MQNKCPSCTKGQCWYHVAEYLTTDYHVRVCTCPDPNNQHGKMPPKEE